MLQWQRERRAGIMINTSIESGYCTISTLYDRIAESLGLSTKDVKYACSKV